ncbi:MAG: hypothetical protein Fur0037_00020 [Planctomycetota bacterium]
MKTVLKLLPVPLLFALFAMVPQAPGSAEAKDVTAVLAVSQVQYVDMAGNTVSLAARGVLEMRVLEDAGEHIRLEILYQNGDYSLVETQGLHVLRSGQDMQDVRFTRTKRDRILFPFIR